MVCLPSPRHRQTYLEAKETRGIYLNKVALSKIRLLEAAQEIKNIGAL